MSNTFGRVWAEVDIDLSYPDEADALKERAIQELGYCLSQQILKDMEALPVTITTSTDPIAPKQHIQMSVNLIGTERYNQLIRAENELFQYKAGRMRNEHQDLQCDKFRG